MHYYNNKVDDLKIAYIGGGSRGWAWTFMTDLAMEESLSGTIKLYDIDVEAAKTNEIIGNNLSKRNDVVGKWNYVTSNSLEDALCDADFIVISILPGTFDEMESDVHLPERLGIFQSVGDTTGPGGLIRSLRTIPMFVEIAEAIKKCSPDAWVINYTNPMSVCVKTLYHVFPEIKAFGCCHEVFGTQRILKGIVQEKLGIKNINRDEIEVNVLGINHFTWFNEASYKGIDLINIYKDYVDNNFDKGYTDPEDHWANASFACINKVKFDLFNKYGLIAAAGDRHLAEFLPESIYLKDEKAVADWGFGLTKVSWRKEDLNKRREKSSDLLTGKQLVTLKSSGEEGILLIKALCGLGSLISNVNIPNTNGQIPNLPTSAIVETNALFRRDSIKPVVAGKLPDNILELILPHVENQETILNAALSCNRELVYKAFKNDPLLKQVDHNQIKKLVDDMINNTLNYLPDGFK